MIEKIAQKIESMSGTYAGYDIFSDWVKALGDIHQQFHGYDPWENLAGKGRPVYGYRKKVWQ